MILRCRMCDENCMRNISQGGGDLPVAPLINTTAGYPYTVENSLFRVNLQKLEMCVILSCVIESVVVFVCHMVYRTSTISINENLKLFIIDLSFVSACTPGNCMQIKTGAFSDISF